MDEIVLRAMQKWPDVPRVYGWLRLDRRGTWLVKGRSGQFERIGNPSVVEFIGRNYAADERGRWFFQNGPQRVFVTLDYAPWVWRLAGDALVSHTGAAAGEVDALFVDEHGSMLASAPAGAGIIDDRDLPQLVEKLLESNPDIADEDELARAPQLRLFGRVVKLSPIRADAAGSALGFDPAPVPGPGEPEC
jgi:hypothetical protein